MDWEAWEKTKALALSSRGGSKSGNVVDFTDAKAVYSTKKSSATVTSSTGFAPKCADTHPALVIGEHKIYGGSCLNPKHSDADVYVGFERGMENFDIYPWSDKHAFTFHIVDGGVPKSIVEFRKLLGFLEDALKAGKKVHIGCIGGHGRTGLVLAALVMHMTGNKNAIEYVRTNYCKKAVESTKQVDWLHQHFKIDKVKASKSAIKHSVELYDSRYGLFEDRYYSALGVEKKAPQHTTSALYATNKHSGDSMLGYVEKGIVCPVQVKGNVWGF